MTACDELRKYANLLADAWTPREKTDDRVEWLCGLVRAEVLREAADSFRQQFGDIVIKGRDGDWANVADYITTGARIPQCGDFYPHHTDTRCTQPKGHRGSHRAPWGERDMAWPRNAADSEPTA